MFYDGSDIQLSTETHEVTIEDTAAKYRAWGWNVLTIDGNDPQSIIGALDIANEEKAKPTLIIGKTIMGKGAVCADSTSYERKCSTHGQPLTHAGASFAKTIENLGVTLKIRLFFIRKQLNFMQNVKKNLLKS